MRRIYKDFHSPPEALSRGFKERKINLLEKKSQHQFDGRIYNTATKSKLKDLYQSKCAYCECFLSDYSFTVEHYRPKSGGYSYYWLGYEWSNLIPVCLKCNNAKGERFPIGVPERTLTSEKQKCRVREPIFLPDGDLDMDTMKADHPYLLDEKPYFLHPEIDDPENFLCITNTGKMIPQVKIDENEYYYQRANQTIELIQLNRDMLIYRRRKIIEKLELQLKKQVLRYLKEEKYFENLDSSLRLSFFVFFEFLEAQFQESEEFTLTSLCIWRNIKDILFRPIANTLENEDICKLLEYVLGLYNKEKKNYASA
ncbi:MAG: HNH endonuclease [Leptospiraceae bacterium]|nr:HNH endonuclease [Leptospiraceae bacterium]